MTSLSQYVEDHPRVARRRLQLDGADLGLPRLPLAAYGPMPTVNAAATGRRHVLLDHAVLPELVEQCIPINRRAALFRQQGKLQQGFDLPAGLLGRHIISRLPSAAYNPIRDVVACKARLFEMKWIRRNRHGDAYWGVKWPMRALWIAIHFGNVHQQWARCVRLLQGICTHLTTSPHCGTLTWALPSK